MERKMIMDLVSKLEELGFKPTISNDEFKPIREVLGDNWYTDKIMELGYTECKYIDLGSTFIAILDDKHLMSGGNCMLSNCFERMVETTNITFEDLISIAANPKVDFYAAEEDDDN